MKTQKKVLRPPLQNSPQPPSKTFGLYTSNSKERNCTAENTLLIPLYQKFILCGKCLILNSYMVPEKRVILTALVAVLHAFISVISGT